MSLRTSFSAVQITERPAVTMFFPAGIGFPGRVRSKTNHGSAQTTARPRISHCCMAGTLRPTPDTTRVRANDRQRLGVVFDTIVRVNGKEDPDKDRQHDDFAAGGYGERDV